MIENPDFYQFGSGWRVARGLGSVRVSDATPSTGIYYLILLPTGWRLAVYRDHDSGKPASHEEFWADEVCDLFVQLWSRALSSRRLESRSRALTANARGFPRGRIAKDGDSFTIFCGHDQNSVPEGIRLQVELIFGVLGLATWIQDDQERCLWDDREAVRSLLQEGVKWLYWPAV